MKSKIELTANERIARLDIMVNKIIDCFTTETLALRTAVNEALETANLITEEDLLAETY